MIVSRTGEQGAEIGSLFFYPKEKDYKSCAWF